MMSAPKAKTCPARPRAFGVDHPVGPPQPGAMGAEGVGLGQRRELAEEQQLTCREGLGEALKEQAPEQPTEDLSRQEEARRTGDPAGPVGG